MNFIKFHLPFILWMMIIFIQSSFPAVDLPSVDIINIDKVAHMGVYGLLAFLCYLSLIKQNSVLYLKKNPFTFTFIITALYGASDEIHQYFVPNRSAEIYDWIADIVGIIIMILILYFILSKRYSFLKPM